MNQLTEAMYRDISTGLRTVGFAVSALERELYTADITNAEIACIGKLHEAMEELRKEIIARKPQT